jgi:hypothetical protein
MGASTEVARAGYAELLIRLLPKADGSYKVELQFSAPGADADTELDAGEATFDFDGLDNALGDVAVYGALLSRGLFGDEKVLSGYRQARAAAAATPLRVRLFIDSDAAELQALRWETLQDPQDGASLVTGERIFFSRYLRSPDWRPLVLRPRAQLRALVVIANPANLASYAPEGIPLQPLDVQQELDLAMSGLDGIPVKALHARGEATLANLSLCLREGYEVLYLVCHGAFVGGRSILYLEDQEGKRAPVSGSELAGILSELRTPPTLVVLASCQSAGSGSRGALAAIGPRLARGGIPAIVAMQGRISMETSGAFMRRFFRELGADGQVDQAVAVARTEVRERPDAWMPVLFTRLKSGCIWSLRNARVEQPFEKWPALIERIRAGRCTPIIGPGMIEFLLGSTRDIARRWAAAHNFPMAPYEREDLPQVTQFMEVTQGDSEFPRVALRRHLEQEMEERYANQLPAALAGASLDDLIREVGRQRREQDPTEPYRVLANLPLPIYITTNPDDLLAEALRAEGKDPQVVLCRWKTDVDWPLSIYDREPTFIPDAQRPLVYHLFGHLNTPGSVVLTEDDYFDYLMAVTRDKTIIPPRVVKSWTSTALLFLGFHVDDWNFRVLFRSIIAEEGFILQGKKKIPSVAVQIDLEQGRSIEPQRARTYLEKYFVESSVNIYWGSAEQFLQELWQQWRQNVPAGR